MARLGQGGRHDEDVAAEGLGLGWPVKCREPHVHTVWLGPVSPPQFERPHLLGQAHLKTSWLSAGVPRKVHVCQANRLERIEVNDHHLWTKRCAGPTLIAIDDEDLLEAPAVEERDPPGDPVEFIGRPHPLTDQK